MSKLYNLARMTSATVGAGTITLGAAVSGYLTFALAGVANGDVVSYGIKDGANSEVGTGTYTSAGTTLTRTVTKSTNSNAAISLSGTAEVYITARAEDIVNVANNLSDVVAATARTNLAVPPTTRNIAASGLVTGGGDLSADRTLTVTAAVKSDQQTGTSTTLAVVPGVQQHHASAAKAWVMFNGSGTILASYNVSSVTHNGAGDYTVNFTTAFSTANYGFSGTCGAGAGAGAGRLVIAPLITSPTASAFRVGTVDTAFALADAPFVSVLFFGTQ